MTIKLEVGKKYKNQAGAVVNIVERKCYLQLYPFRDANNHTYAENGRWHLHTNSALDLVEEVVDGDGLTIQEALKSGRPFKRKGETYFYSSSIYTTADVLATDWEVEPESKEVTITAKQFWEAVQDTMYDPQMSGSKFTVIHAVAKKLGLT